MKQLIQCGRSLTNYENIQRKFIIGLLYINSIHFILLHIAGLRSLPAMFITCIITHINVFTQSFYHTKVVNKKLAVFNDGRVVCVYLQHV